MENNKKIYLENLSLKNNNFTIIILQLKLKKLIIIIGQVNEKHVSNILIK